MAQRARDAPGHAGARAARLVRPMAGGGRLAAGGRLPGGCHAALGASPQQSQQQGGSGPGREGGRFPRDRGQAARCPAFGGVRHVTRARPHAGTPPALPSRVAAAAQGSPAAPHEFREKHQCPVLQGAALWGEQGQNPLYVPSLLRSPLSQGIFLPSIPFVALLLLPFPSAGCQWVSCSGSAPCAPAGCAWGAPWQGALPANPGRTPSCQGAQGGYRRREKLNNPVTGMKVNSRSGEH